MKCVCGYEYIYAVVYENGDCAYKVIKGDDEFILSDMFLMYEEDYYTKKPILVCPKCGTLKIEV